MASAEQMTEEIQAAYREYSRKTATDNFNVACLLGAVLMPAGVMLDWFVYPELLLPFLKLRILCSICIIAFWALLRTPLGQRYYQVQGVTLLALPALFISLMIYRAHDSASPYYAGLNLVLLVLAFVLHWTFWESLVATGLVTFMYVAVSLLGGTEQFDFGHFFNNMYFLSLTGIIVVTGSYTHTKLRQREFASRYELDQNRKVLQESNEKLTQLDQVKSRFFANISHELRTPLTLLIAPLECLIHGRNRAQDEESRQLLHTMHGNAMRLLKLINDLLDLVRLDSGVLQVKREAVDLRDFLRGLASAARQVAQDKRINLEAIVDPELGMVMVDRDKLEKIILNLQFNALKFTGSGGVVEVRAERHEGRLRLQVKDTGMGISAENLPHIFDRFWQADTSSRRKYQGVGIGLALVKELVEVQEGTVIATSELGVGTTFTLSLPYLVVEKSALPASDADAASTSSLGSASAPSAAVPVANGPTVSNEEWLAQLYRRAELFPTTTASQDAARPIESGARNNAPKVLVADDEPDMLRFLKSQLTSQYQVIEACDGQQAVDKAAQFLPDIILLDMMMPEKDGLQACRELREKVATKTTPVILLTARADEETKMAALAAGASDFLAKPFSTTELHVRIHNLIESHTYQRKLTRQNQQLENTIEQLKETESLLVQTEKIASLGRLSAGIIHEINNPLNFATTGLYTLRKKARLLPEALQPEYTEILTDVEDGIKRVRDIVSDLRSFTHPSEGAVDEVPVHEVVEQALRFLSGEWRSSVQVLYECVPGQVIRANRNKLIQVMINLVQNALDAVKEKTFTTDQPTVWIEGRIDNGRSVLQVRDNGQGIDPEVLDKIFDPFFTTKDVGKGMGLGLSICYRIVQDYEGQITVRSERGQSTSFTMDFPLIKQANAARTISAKEADTYATGV